MRVLNPLNYSGPGSPNVFLQATDNPLTTKFLLTIFRCIQIDQISEYALSMRHAMKIMFSNLERNRNDEGIRR